MAGWWTRSLSTSIKTRNLISFISRQTYFFNMHNISHNKPVNHIRDKREHLGWLDIEFIVEKLRHWVSADPWCINQGALRCSALLDLVLSWRRLCLLSYCKNFLHPFFFWVMVLSFQRLALCCTTCWRETLRRFCSAHRWSICLWEMAATAKKRTLSRSWRDGFFFIWLVAPVMTRSTGNTTVKFLSSLINKVITLFITSIWNLCPSV